MIPIDAHLTDILTPSNLVPILTSSPTFINSLIPYLPTDLPLSSPPTQSEIQSIISSSQWTEAVAGLDSALRTGALTGTMGSLGMSERAGQGVGEFLEEVIRQGEEQKDETQTQTQDKMDTD
jgi:26S proteasome regulatory subunit N13